MILELIKPQLNTPDKIKEAYAIFSSWLFSNFLFFFVIFYTVFISYRLGANIGSTSFFIIVIVAVTLLFFARKLIRGLLIAQSVFVNHLVFYIFSAMNLLLMGWILISVLG